MPKQRTGYVRERKVAKNGKQIIEYWARVTYTDLDGKRKSIERKANNKSHGKTLLRDILNDLDQRGTKGVEASKMTFAQFAEWYTEHYLIPPEYVDGRKVAGLRSWRDQRYLKNTLVSYFGGAKLREITYTDLKQYKKKRLNSDVVLRKKDGSVSVRRQRSIRSANLELALLRRMFSVAQKEGLITKSPFITGDTLINEADERKRMRILTKDEEGKLLEACSGPRAHLRSIIICALDTGMRAGEIFKLKWANVDLTRRSIHIIAFNTKTMSARHVPISDRLFMELTAIIENRQPKPDELVFGISETIKKAFDTARKLAGVPDFRLHDCRHCYATRLIQAGMPIEEVARLLGHADISTTYRYVNPTADTARRALEILNRHD